MRLEEEKELLVLKGNILRLKLRSHGNTKKREISSPLQNINFLGSVLNQPLIRSLLFTAVSKKLFTARSIVCIFFRCRRDRDRSARFFCLRGESSSF